MKKEKVIVGMSGGVDSAVAAYLLKAQGYEVVGVTLRTWEADDGSDGRCCDIDDARTAAERIGIRYIPVNCTDDFRRYVVDPFTRDYLSGVTPNPCIGCNRYVKWAKLIQYADILDAPYVATGHYARVERLANGRYTVKKALHAEKDQTYMLYRLSQEQLARTLMPLGGLSKEDVRRIAREAGIPVADKPDSQDVCFVADGSYADHIARTGGAGAALEGNFVDVYGNILGRHKGIIHYTVGQRKGLGIALGSPAYVREIRPETNEVVLCDDASLYTDGILCRDVNFMSIEGLEKDGELPCFVKIRYRHEGQDARIGITDGGLVKVTFKKPVRAAAPGQSAVFYGENGEVIGGGIITK